MSVNGKGDKTRSGANPIAYWNNYDNIFRREKKTIDQWAEHFGDMLKNYDGFREMPLDKLITESEYNNGVVRCTLYGSKRRF